MALILCRPMLQIYIYNANLKYLKDNNCDDTLYKLVEYAASRAGGLQYLVRVEGSTKESSKEQVSDRCTVTMRLWQWDSYRKEDQDLVLSCLHFTREQLTNFIADYLPLVNTSTDIIFGKAESAGKIYLDFCKIKSDSSGLALVCMESTGKIKYYVSTKDKGVPLGTHISYSSINGENPVPETVHYPPQPGQEYNGYPVYWQGEGLQSKTYYTRPKYVPWLSELYDLGSLLIKPLQKPLPAHCKQSAHPR